MAWSARQYVGATAIVPWSDASYVSQPSLLPCSHIQSRTKGKVAALVGTEVVRNDWRVGLSWHRLIRTWLPELSSLTSDPKSENSLVDLLSHRVGVTGVDDFWMGADNVVFVPRSEAVRAFASLKSAEPLRTSFAYSQLKLRSGRSSALKSHGRDSQRPARDPPLDTTGHEADKHFMGSI